MVPVESTKKKVKKLVVEETSVPEAPIEAVIEEDLPKEEEPQERSVLLPPEEEEKEEEKEETESEESSETEDSKVSAVWVIVLALFIIASLAGGGILVFRAGVEKGKLEATGGATETSTPTPTPSASPSAEIKREDLKVQVLNGTGKGGVAASAQEYLEGLGYKNVEIGNADSSDFTETEISIKDSKKNYLETLKRDLSKKYTVADTVGTLSSGSEFDTTVTIGSK